MSGINVMSCHDYLKWAERLSDDEWRALSETNTRKIMGGMAMAYCAENSPAVQRKLWSIHRKAVEDLSGVDNVCDNYPRFTDYGEEIEAAYADAVASYG